LEALIALQNQISTEKAVKDLGSIAHHAAAGGRPKGPILVRG
jgi:hypothetical protein